MDSKASEGDDRHSVLQQQPVYTSYSIPPPHYQPLEDANQTPAPQIMVYHPTRGSNQTTAPQILGDQPLGNANHEPVPQIMGYQPYLVITQQTIQREAQPMVVKPEIPTYMGLSVCTTLSCCILIGIAAIFESYQVSSLRYSNPQKAKVKSDTAKNLNIIGVVAGIIIWVTNIALRL